MIKKRWTIQEILNLTTDFFREKGIDSARLCAEVLLSHQLKKSRLELYLEYDQPLCRDEIAGYRSLVRRRSKREPLQYITGHQEFWSLDFFVSPAVLIPRPETEILVEEAIRLKQGNRLSDNTCPTILDLGTGSGAIAISLAKEIECATVWASDISPEALAVAKENAKYHNLDNRIRFCQGDLWEPFLGNSIRFDMIISNPPYISTEAFNTLQPEVGCYEPRVALDGHEGGMYYIQRLIEESGSYLKSGGWLLIEMDPDQTERALYLLDAMQTFGYKERVLDYQRKFRLVKVQKKNG